MDRPVRSHLAPEARRLPRHQAAEGSIANAIYRLLSARVSPHHIQGPMELPYTIPPRVQPLDSETYAESGAKSMSGPCSDKKLGKRSRLR